MYACIFSFGRRESDKKFARPRIRAEFFFPVTKPTQECAWSIRRVTCRGHVRGLGAVHRVCFQHETPATLPRFRPYSHGKDFLWENPGEAWLALVSTAPWEECLRWERRPGPTYNMVILGRKHLLSYVLFPSAQPGTTSQAWISIATYEANTTFSA